MLLVYDVETSGLPDWTMPSNHPAQPHIIQIGAILADDNGKEIERINIFIKPDGWTLPPEITKLTGITQEMLVEKGIPIKDAVETFIALWRKCTKTVAHNDNFDRRLFRIEMARLYGRVPLLDEWKNAPAFCTMRSSTDIVKCPPTKKMIDAGRTGYKSPKLIEAYEHFFKRKPEVSHDAMADVESTLAIYFELMKLQQAA